MQTLSELFDQTTLVTLLRTTPIPAGAQPLVGHNLVVKPLPNPRGTDLRRKLALLAWLPRYLPTLWRAVAQAEAVHTPVPGDLGTIGLLLALIQRKQLFVRHCGTWGDRSTLANRFLAWLLPRIAGGRNVVLATGGGEAPPEPGNPNIHWIFSTTLTQAEWETLPQAQPWQPGEPLQLVTVGRLSAGKNVQAAIQALRLLLDGGQEVTLDVVGEGEQGAALQQLAAEAGVQNQVIFHGNVPHACVLEVLSRAHLFIFPTRTREGFPKALLEAMACGLPAVAARVSVIPHLLGEGTGKTCGAVVDDPTPEALAAAVRGLLAEPGGLAVMGAAGRAASRGYTLEGWREAIGVHLWAAWGQE